MDMEIIERVAQLLSKHLGPGIDEVKKAVNDILQLDLVKPTKRVGSFCEAHIIPKEVFDFNHSLRCVAEMFQSMSDKGSELSSIIVGHKNQGKSQYIYFLMMLLQQLGEIVLFLDDTVLRTKGLVSDAIGEEKKFCIKLWQKSFNKALGSDDDQEAKKNQRIIEEVCGLWESRII